MAENIIEFTTTRPTDITSFPIITKPPQIQPWGPHSGRCSKGGFQIYEKTPGFALGVEDIRASMFTAAVPGITAECRARCDMDPACSGFTQDYLKLTCLFHAVDVADDAARQRLIRAPSSAYFEITCIKVVTGCDRLWAFDRLLDKSFLAFATETHLGISKAACEESCLAEKRFVCRAMTYNRFRGECRLFKDDRFMLPQAFIESAGTDYFENQCAGTPFFIAPSKNTRQGGTCDVVRRQGMFLQYADTNTPATSERECEHVCSINSNFTCRSYSFLGDQKQCLLSAVTATEIGMPLMNDNNSVYVERICEEQPVITTTISPTDGQTCTAAGFSMERTIGVTAKIHHKNVLNANSLIGRTKHCIRNCNRVKDVCKAFVQKLGMSCLSFNSAVDRRDLVASPGSIYFEKVCLRAIGCGKLWIFDRLIGFEFPSNEAKRIHLEVSTRQGCQELCLLEGAFVCRSIVYVYSKKECRLYPITRYTNPSSFRATDKKNVDYMENQCAPEP
uniref:Apple domain-containing protein n=1 Tax=Strigamia maritima TaxID=126957 RepID=T1J1D9_STRMM